MQGDGSVVAGVVKSKDDLIIIDELRVQKYYSRNRDLLKYFLCLSGSFPRPEYGHHLHQIPTEGTIEAGIFNESTKDRMNELEEQKKDLRVALAAAKLKEDLVLKKKHIIFFLHQFAGMDYSDIDCQKRLIKVPENTQLYGCSLV